MQPYQPPNSKPLRDVIPPVGICLVSHRRLFPQSQTWCTSVYQAHCCLVCVHHKYQVLSWTPWQRGTLGHAVNQTLINISPGWTRCECWDVNFFLPCGAGDQLQERNLSSHKRRQCAFQAWTRSGSPVSHDRWGRHGTVALLWPYKHSEALALLPHTAKWQWASQQWFTFFLKYITQLLTGDAQRYWMNKNLNLKHTTNSTCVPACRRPMIAFKILFVFFEGIWLIVRASTDDPIRLPWLMRLLWRWRLRVRCIIMKSVRLRASWGSAWLVLGKLCTMQHISVRHLILHREDQNRDVYWGEERSREQMDGMSLIVISNTDDVSLCRCEARVVCVYVFLLTLWSTSVSHGDFRALCRSNTLARLHFNHGTDNLNR